MRVQALAADWVRHADHEIHRRKTWSGQAAEWKNSELLFTG
jgi:hypothetical protein